MIGTQLINFKKVNYSLVCRYVLTDIIEEWFALSDDCTKATAYSLGKV